jgi:hypothetical protein
MAEIYALPATPCYSLLLPVGWASPFHSVNIMGILFQAIVNLIGGILLLATLITLVVSEGERNGQRQTPA